MKTSHFLRAMGDYGWEQGRTGGSHVLLVNRLFTADRPLALPHDRMRQIDPEYAENTAKKAGLVWYKDGSLRPNPNHPYFNRYIQAGVARAA